VIDDTSPPGSYAGKFRDAPTYPAYLDRMASTAAHLEHQHILIAASQLARHGAEQRRDKIVTKAKAIAERLERPDLVERLTR
jgi:hypothetical protein